MNVLWDENKEHIQIGKYIQFDKIGQLQVQINIQTKILHTLM